MTGITILWILLVTQPMAINGQEYVNYGWVPSYTFNSPITCENAKALWSLRSECLPATAPAPGPLAKKR